MLTNLEMEMFLWIVFGFNDAASAPIVPLVNTKIYDAKIYMLRAQTDAWRNYYRDCSIRVMEDLQEVTVAGSKKGNVANGLESPVLHVHGPKRCMLSLKYR